MNRILNFSTSWLTLSIQEMLLSLWLLDNTLSLPPLSFLSRSFSSDSSFFTLLMLECPWTLFLDYIFVSSLSLLPWLFPMVIHFLELNIPLMPVTTKFMSLCQKVTEVQPGESIFTWMSYCSSVTQLCLVLCDSMNRNIPAFPVLHYLLEIAQTHVH